MRAKDVKAWVGRMRSGYMQRKLQKKEYVSMQEREAYKAQVLDRKYPYLVWMRTQEPGLNCVDTKQYETLRGGQEWVLLSTDEIRLADKAAEYFLAALSQKPEAWVFYGDEDYFYEDESGFYRMHPYFKPEYSPELLRSWAYMGELLFVRRKVLEELGRMMAEKEERACEVPEHICSVFGEDMELRFETCSVDEMYHLQQQLSSYFGAQAAEKIGHISAVCSHKSAQSLLSRTGHSGGKDWENVAEQLADIFKNDCYLKETLPGFCPETVENYRKEWSVSVVILSKDHPELLRNCILSLKKYESDCNPEIIVVDNGSSEENRALNEEFAHQQQFAYYYHPMEFNFSALCNYGVSKSSGEYVLLLNDDVEWVEEGCLRPMLELASQEGVGAVGARLLFGDRHSIQHAGVTNLAVGPSHKLLGFNDEWVYYFGANRVNREVLAVTGAALLVKKSLYELVGGLNETLKVAYNDVAFCMELARRGYRNILCNQAKMLHLESVTRGEDADSGEKWERLLSEKERLYALYPEFSGAEGLRDPYYSEHLITDASEYSVNVHFPDTDTRCVSAVHLLTGKEAHERLSGIDKNFVINGRAEQIEYRRKNIRTDENVCEIRGWSYCIGADGAAFQRELLLVEESTKAYYSVSLADVYRPDVAAAFPYERNLELSGFIARIREKDLPDGIYKMALLSRTKNGRFCSLKQLETVFTKETK